MPKYLLVYHGGSMPESEEEGAKIMQDWMSWFGSLGAAVADGGNPTSVSKTIAAGGKVTDGGGANATTGYSVISAANLDDAVKLAKGCPHLNDKGATLEVAELVEMG